MDIPDNCIDEILESNPSQGTLYVILNMLKEKGRLALVISECLKAVSRYPDDYTLKKILAEAYLGDGRLLEAEGEFEKVIVSIKELAEAYRHQAEVYVRQKREKDAVESLRQYLAFYPENEEVESLLGELQTVLDAPPVEPDVDESNTEIVEPEDLKVDDNNRQKKERMIMVLDSWLNSIKGLAGDGLTAS